MTTHARPRGPSHQRSPASTAGAPTVWGRSINALLSRAHVVGIDTGAMKRALAVDDAALADVDARVPLEALYRLVELTVEWTGDELAPLRMVRGIDMASLDALGFLAITSPTLGGAIEAVIRYQRVFAEGERYGIERAGDEVHVRYQPWGPPRLAHVTWADLFAVDLAVNTFSIVGGTPEGVRVRLRRSRPRDFASYTELLGVVPELDAPLDEVIFSAATMELPIPRADAMLAAFFARYLDERLARLPPDSPVARAAAVVEQMLPAGDVELGLVAKKMHVSPRTLQRRLADEKTSFGEVVDETRKSRALALIDSGSALAEVSWLLGYSEPRAFHRAFRRWTGMSPAAWRARSTG